MAGGLTVAKLRIPVGGLPAAIRFETQSPREIRYELPFCAHEFLVYAFAGIEEYLKLDFLRGRALDPPLQVSLNPLEVVPEIPFGTAVMLLRARREMDKQIHVDGEVLVFQHAGIAGHG